MTLRSRGLGLPGVEGAVSAIEKLVLTQFELMPCRLPTEVYRLVMPGGAALASLQWR